MTYSDLHLEFGASWIPPQQTAGDLMILAGDIVTLRDYRPLDRILQQWQKPVLYVTGNHEYYTRTSMAEENARFRGWLDARHPYVKLLMDEEAAIGGVNFFGGTMWTDFNGRDPRAMDTAHREMNDYQLILNSDGSRFRPEDSVALHEQFVAKLFAWFAKDLTGPRVVVTHNAPVINPRTKYRHSPLWPAFNSLDMMEVIEKQRPALWVYGHTHECDDQKIGVTRIISNQLGYPDRTGAFECPDFDPAGVPVDLDRSSSAIKPLAAI